MVVRDFHNKYALILGGSSGLGLASAHKLAQHGMNLIIVHRSARMQLSQIESELTILRNHEVRVLDLNIDATREDQIDTYIQQCNDFINGHKLHLLLHSISKGNLKATAGENHLTTADYQQTIHSMGTSLSMWVNRLLSEQLLDSPSRIISFTSEGNDRLLPNYGAVAAAKSVLEQITKALAIELAPKQITVNCIQAGVTLTPSMQRIPQSTDIVEKSIKRNPHQRLTTAQDVANAVYLLTRTESQWITGSIIKVDGGEHLV